LALASAETVTRKERANKSFIIVFCDFLMNGQDIC
jgi:hypothetical protein